MEIDQTVNVPVTTTEAGVDSTQVGHVHLLSRVGNKDSTFFIFQSNDFFGHQVVTGFRIDSFDKNVLSIYFKVAICAPADTYDPSLGEEIVLGRLLKADINKPRVSIEVSQMSDDEISKAVTQAVTSFLSTFGETLVIKDRQFEIFKTLFDKKKREFRKRLDNVL